MKRLVLLLSVVILLLPASCSLDGIVEAPTYTVVYNANGGSGIMQNSFHVYGIEKKLNINIFSNVSGITFTGWAREAEGPVLYQNEQSVKNLTKTGGQTVTLYAQWAAGVTYNVVYNANGGSGTMENCVHTATMTQNLALNLFTREGYTFAGWAASPGGSAVYEDQQKVLNLSVQGTNVTLYASWTGVNYRVVYDANGGTGTMGESSHVYGTPQSLRANAFTRTGYSFAGWGAAAAGPVLYDNQQSAVNLTTAAGSSVTLYAIWGDENAITYSISYERNGGTGSMTNSVHIYDVARLLSANTFRRTGHTFAGWGTLASGPIVYGDGEFILNLTATHGTAIILYAQWTVNNYTVSYNANGGSGSVGASTHTYGISQELNANSFIRAGHYFAGWSLSADGPVTYENRENVVNLSEENEAVVVLYAQWIADFTLMIQSPVENNCVFEENGGNGDGMVNPGENAQLQITVRNSGTQAISGILAELSGYNTSYITMDTVFLSVINAGNTHVLTFSLYVASTCPAGPLGPLTLTLTETGGENRKWVDIVPALYITIHTPENVKSSANGYGNITLTWNAVSGENVSYIVYGSETLNGDYLPLHTVTSTTYIHSGLEEGQQWYYKVSAVDSVNTEGLLSAASNGSISWKTLPVFNDAHNGGSISAGLIHHYRFPVISGTQYRVSWTGNVRVSAVRASGTGAAWFDGSASSGQSRTADFSGYMVLVAEGTGSGSYTVRVDSGTQAVSSFGFNIPPSGMINGMIDHNAKTIEVTVPFQTNVTALVPVITGPAESYSPEGAQNFTNPVKYVFRLEDGSSHVYTVTVTALGQGSFTIILPQELEDEAVGSFTGGFIISKSGTGHNSNHTLLAVTGYTSYEWYVDGIRKMSDAEMDRRFIVRAVDYPVGTHTITIIVYKDGRPYSNERSFEVRQ